MATHSPREAETLDRPLWCVRLGAHGVCTAETAEGSFLVLFTSSSLAGQFIREEGVDQSERASPRLYSNSRGQFMFRARSAAADGIQGTLVDLQSDGQVGEIIHFRALAMEVPLARRFLRRSGQTLH